MKTEYSVRKFLSSDRHDNSTITGTISTYETCYGDAELTLSDGRETIRFRCGIGCGTIGAKDGKKKPDPFVEKLETLIGELQEFIKAYKKTT